MSYSKYNQLDIYYSKIMKYYKLKSSIKTKWNDIGKILEMRKFELSILKIEAYYIRRIKLFIKINSKKVLTLQQATYIIDMVTR